MKRATDHPTRVGGDPLSEDSRALDHLARRAAGESEQKDTVGCDARAQQPGHARAQRRGLARARPGEDQKRVARVRGGRTLLDVELVEPGAAVALIEHVFGTLGHSPDGEQQARSSCADAERRAR